MKKYFCTSILTIFLFTVSICQSQWQKLNGPFGACVPEIINHNGAIFITINKDQTAGGVFKTTNNGVVWNDVTQQINGPYTRNFASIGTNLYVAQDTSIFWTTNNGSTWTDISGNLPIYDPVTLIVAHNNILFAVVYDGSGYEELFYTTNNGSTWQTTGFIQGISSSFNSFYSDGINLWAATGEGVYLSTDDGLTWLNKSTNIPFSAFVSSIVAKGDTLYCGTSNGVYYSVDGADLWMPAIGGITQQTFGSCFVLSGNTVYMGTNNEGVYSTTLGNNFWTSVGTLPNYTGVQCMAINGNELLIGQIDGFQSLTLPTGTWTMHVDGLVTPTIRAVYVEGNMMLSSIANNRGVQISNDAGITWQPTTLGTGKFITGVKKFDNTYFAFSPLSGLHTSPDGINWNFIPNGIGVNCMTSSGNSLSFGGTNGLYASTNNGVNWQLTGAGLPLNANVYDIAVSGMDMYVVIGSNKIYVSHDGGNTFALGNNGNSFTSQCMKVEVVDSYVMAFALNSVYRSSDGGSTFSSIGLQYFGPPYDTHVSGKNIFAATSNGILVSDNIGKSWHQWNDGFNQYMNLMYCLGADGTTLYSGSDNAGLWKRNFMPGLVTSNLNGSQLCAGNTVTVNFNATATFNPGNRFYVELSDSAGHFANPVLLDSLIATSPSPIACMLPVNTIEGTLYRIRVTATDPYVVLQDNGFDFSVNEIPSIIIQPANQYTCDGSGSGFFVGAQGTNISYQWQVNTGGSIYNNLSNNATYSGVNNNLLLINSTTGSMNGYKYRCIVSGTCTPADTSNYGILNVSSPAPAISLQPTNVTICDSTTTSFTLTATGPSLGYQWQCDNGTGFFFDVNNAPPYSGATTNTLTIATATALMDGFRFRCRISDCIESDDALLTVNGTPVAPNISVTQIVCNGATAFIGLNVPGSGIGYQWQENNGSGFVNISNTGNYSGANTNLLSVANITPSMNGYQYQCIITGLCNPFSSTSVPTQINVNSVIASILQQPANASACEKSNAWFTVNATTTGFLYYNWEMNDGSGWIPVPALSPFSGTDQDTLKIDTVNFAMNNYQFRCLVSACTYSNAATLIVHQFPPVNMNQFPAYFCFNDPAVILSGGLPSGGTYYGSGISGNAFSPAAAGVGSIPISYFYTDAYGCSASVTQNLVVDFCIGAGVLEIISTKNDWIIYPNPARDFITIKNKYHQGKQVSLHIFNTVGQCVKQKEFKSFSSEQIDVNGFYNGLYIVVIDDGEQRFSERFFVLK